MQARLTTKPVEEVIAAIQALDLDSVKTRVMDAELGEGWSREYADSIEVAYKTYLTMLVKYPEEAEDILLAEDVDEFWHTHILQTRKYSDDCQRVFGNYLHHEPHVGEVTAADLDRRAAQAEKTRNLYEREFSAAPGHAWSGMSASAETAAFSGASIRGEQAAFSGASIEAAKSAFSGASIKAQRAAFSGASIQAAKAAFSGASIKAERAAFSGASIVAGAISCTCSCTSSPIAHSSGFSLRIPLAVPMACGCRGTEKCAVRRRSVGDASSSSTETERLRSLPRSIRRPFTSNTPL